MSRQYITEAFKALDILCEGTSFDLRDSNDITGAAEFIDKDSALDVEDIIDPEANTAEELSDSYLGKVICECEICHSLVYKDKEEIQLSEDNEEVVNVGDECPFCYSVDGYSIVGEVAPYEQETEYNVEVEPKDEEAEITESQGETCHECGKNPCVCTDESLKEALENIDVETEHDKIHIEAEEKEATSGEMIAPLSDETEEEIVEPEPDEEATENDEPEFADFDFDDVDDDTVNYVGESYLKKVYNNVNSFKATNASIDGNKLVIEGVINFKSGKNKKTQFIFEANTATKSGNVRFIGENAQITKGKKAFTLNGQVKDNKLMIESLNYNYRANKTRVYGTVKAKKA